MRPARLPCPKAGPFVIGLMLGWLALSSAGQPALAQSATTDPAAPLSAAAFEAYVTGKTLSYARGMRRFGQETYLPGRRVIWSVAPGECQTGQWFAQGDAICFVYSGDLTPRCWIFGTKAGRLTARSMEDPGLQVVEYSQSDQPPPCFGDGAGV